MVNFYCDDCKHCIDNRPIWLDFASDDARLGEVTMGVIECTQNKHTCYELYPRNSCPSVMMFKTDAAGHTEVKECEYGADFDEYQMSVCLAFLNLD